MKKLLWVLLILAVPLCAAFAVYAQEQVVTTIPSSVSCDIVADFVPGSYTVTHAYSVTITWLQSGTLTYSAQSGSYTWDPNALQYTGESTGGSWTVQNAQVSITVVNRSDAKVVATCEVEANYHIGIEGTFDHSTLTLESAAQDLTGYEGTGTATSATATYTITQMAGSITASGTIGSITVSLTTE